MKLVSQLLIGLVSVEHLYILWLEMFAWETKGKKVFAQSLSPDLFTPTKKLAANQGLYNGFLAVGLIWSLFIQNLEWQSNVALYFLGCVAIAGMYGAYSASRKIFFVQALPALIAFVFVFFSRP